MSETPPPMPSNPADNKPAGKLTHATNMARNVIVSVTSTVLGATLIYFLGFQHRGDDPLAVKEATTKAWKSYVTAENIYYKNSLSLLKDLQANKKLSEFREGILKESDKFMSDLPEMIKDKKIDPSFVTMINRRMDNERTTVDKEKTYLTHLQNILDANYSAQEREQKINAEDNDWAIYTRGAYERAITDVEDIAKSLTDRYGGQNFQMSELLVYGALKEQNKQQETKPTNGNTQVNPANDNGAPADPAANNTQNDPNNTNNVAKTNTNNPEPVDNNNNRKANYNELDASMLEGSWDTYNAGIDLYKNGTMYWSPDNAEETSGSWKVQNGQLIMYPSPNSYIRPNTTWVFNISNLSARSFTMTLTVTPYNRYVLTRTQN